jgi:hypothetical protein
LSGKSSSDTPDPSEDVDNSDSLSDSSKTADSSDQISETVTLRHNLGHDENCNHIRRARFSLGIDSVPSDAVDNIDENPSAFTDASVSFATGDGSGEVVEKEDEDYDCDGLSDDLPCWECYRKER